ncbi:mucin-19-like [Patiria miniata]|uniref:Uncharacterized protein n=1 Tax=Patiria miniata TaxID=46514 RepID=A0A914AXY6_PATMI|nr:mucin-19-like [Patiria miniata]
MAANVSESPGQPPGEHVAEGHSPSEPKSVETCEKSSGENSTVELREKQTKEKQPTPIICSPSKSKRKLDSSEGHDDSTCDPQLENLCRKKFKPIAPKPTVKKDHHQSVVTATVPIKDVNHSDFGSSFCVTKSESRKGAVMFVSPKVQLIPSVPIIAHAPALNGETLSSNGSPFSMTVPLLPHGKYLNIMNPPARVAMTDIAGHYKTVVQLLPNGSSHGCLQPTSLVSTKSNLNKASVYTGSSKTASVRSEPCQGKNGISANKTSKTKTVSKPKASRYKYSLLMNGGSYDSNIVTTTTAYNPKPQTCITPAVSLNGGVRLNLPAVLTSSGILQITVPSVGIANGQVQFCDVPPPADVVHTQSSVAQTTTSVARTTCTTAQSVNVPGITRTLTSTVQPVITTSAPITSTSNRLTQSNVTEQTTVANTNGMSLDETLRVMLRSPRSNVSKDRQKETCQTKKTKPNRTGASTTKSRSKGHKTQTSASLASSVRGSNNAHRKSGGRSGIANSVSGLVAEEFPSRPVDSVQRTVPSGYVSEQRNTGATTTGQTVQYRQADIGANTTTEEIALGQGEIPNHRIQDVRPSSNVANCDPESTVHSVTSSVLTSTSTSDFSKRLVDTSVSAPLASEVHEPITNMPSQNLDYVRQSTLPLNVSTCTSNNLPSSIRTVNDQWPRTITTAQRASSLPNFATGPRGFFTSTTTAPLVMFNVPQAVNCLAQQGLQDGVAVPSTVNFQPVPALPKSSTVQSMQSKQTTNFAATPTTFVSLNQSVTVSEPNSRTVFSSSTCSGVIGRNAHSHMHRNSSVLRSHDGGHPGSTVESLQMPNETIRPHGNSLNSSHQTASNQRPHANSHTAVTYSHNTVTSVQSGNCGFPSTLSGSSNTTVPPTLPTPPVPHGTYQPEVSRPRLAHDSGSSVRDDRGVVSARRQLKLPDENPRTMHSEINAGIGSVGHNQPNSGLPSAITIQTDHEPVVPRPNVETSVPRPNGLHATSLANVRPEQSFFTPPLPVVPHHAGILATAILRSRALERNPWGIPGLNVSTPSGVPNTGLAQPMTVTPNTSAGFFRVTQAVNATSSTTTNMHPTDHRLHLRQAAGMPSSVERCVDREIQNWPATTEGILTRQEGNSLPGTQATQLPLERPGSMVATPPGFTGGGSTDQGINNPVTTESGDQVQNIQGHVQSVPLHSNIPPTARNAVNEALQRRARNLRMHPPRSETSSSVGSTQSHISSVIVSSVQEGSISTGTQPSHPVADRTEMTSHDSQHETRGHPRQESLSHQQPSQHMHAVSSARVPSESMSHLPVPLMPPPSVLYGSSTPVPNISMTPLHGVPLPGSLSAHSVQGHGMSHQLHATPPPAPHHGQATGPNPQAPVNHMFVPTPYGPIHRSLYMPPPSPHPPDLSLMSPRSYGQVHVHDSVLYSPRFSSPIRNLPGSSLAEGMFGTALSRSFSDDRLDTCCSGPYSHSPPIHDNSGHMFPPGFMSPSMMNRNQPALQTSLCNSHQRLFNHRGHQGTPDRYPGPFFHDGMRQPAPHQNHAPVTQASSFNPTPSAVVDTSNSLDSSVLVSVASSCIPPQQTSLGNSLPVSTLSPTSSSTSATTPGSTASSSVSENSALPLTPTSSCSTTPVRVLNVGNTSDKYLPLELVVSSPPTTVTTSASVTTLPVQLGSEQIVKFGDVMLECSRQILRESGRTVLCCWGCDYHTAEPKKMYRHQRRDEQPMKCQLCSHMGVSRCQLNQHFKDVHMDKDEDPFRTSAVP